MSAPISQDEDGYLDLAAIEDAAEWLLAWALRMDTDYGHPRGSINDAARRVVKSADRYAPWQVEIARLLLTDEKKQSGWWREPDRAAVVWEASAKAAAQFILQASDKLDEVDE